MIRIAFTAALLLCAGTRVPAAVPRHVMSLYLCSDQLLLQLLPPDRITSVTYLSREPHESYLAPQAWQVGINYGSAEEVVRDRPDLVIAGLYTTSATRLLIRQAGIPLLEVPPANSFGDIRTITRLVGRAVGAGTEAERLLQQMDATLARLAADAPRTPLRIVGWNGSGFVDGRGTLFDAILTAAGATNLGAAPGLQQGSFGVEKLLTARADLLAFGDATTATPALHDNPLAHPAVRRLYAGRQVVYPELLYSCGLPQSAQAAVQLRDVMQQALRKVPP